VPALPASRAVVVRRLDRKRHDALLDAVEIDRCLGRFVFFILIAVLFIALLTLVRGLSFIGILAFVSVVFLIIGLLVVRFLVAGLFSSLSGSTGDLSPFFSTAAYTVRNTGCW